MRKSSPAQLALIDLPDDPAAEAAAAAGVSPAEEAGLAASADRRLQGDPQVLLARRAAQAVMNVQQCQALLDVIARVPPAGAAVPPARPSGRRVRRAHVEERRIQQLAALYAAFERTQDGQRAGASRAVSSPVPGPAANDERRSRGRGTRVA